MLLTKASTSILLKANIAWAQVGSNGVHAGGVLGTWSIDQAFIHICSIKTFEEYQNLGTRQKVMTSTSMLLTSASTFIFLKAIIAWAQVGAKGVHAG